MHNLLIRLIVYLLSQILNCYDLYCYCIPFMLMILSPGEARGRGARKQAEKAYIFLTLWSYLKHRIPWHRHVFSSRKLNFGKIQHSYTILNGKTSPQ